MELAVSTHDCQVKDVISSFHPSTKTTGAHRAADCRSRGWRELPAMKQHVLTCPGRSPDYSVELRGCRRAESPAPGGFRSLRRQPLCCRLESKQTLRGRYHLRFADKPACAADHRQIADE